MIQENVPLAPYTSWKIGGPAEYFSLPESLTQIMEVWDWAEERMLPVTVLGGGSNVLISDLGVKGLVIALRKYVGVELISDHARIQLRCKSGTPKSELLKIFLKHQNPAALFLAGLPGDVGGGIVMNAGVSEDILPREFEHIVKSIKVLRRFGKGKFKIYEFEHKTLGWSYRHCDGWQPGVIVEALLSWNNTIQSDLLERVKLHNRLRLSRQPLDKPSCGSVFRNPSYAYSNSSDSLFFKGTGPKAAKLIQDCGLKGLTLGDAQVSQKHSNFIVNLGRATSHDTWTLIRTVQEEVQKKTGIKLETEVVRIGIW